MHRNYWFVWISQLAVAVAAVVATPATTSAGPLAGCPGDDRAIARSQSAGTRAIADSDASGAPDADGNRGALPLEELVGDGTIKFELTSDGVRTTRCQIKLTNTTNKDVTVLIPLYQTFISPDRRFQDTMSTEEKVVTVRGSSVEAFPVQTISVSTKLERSPPTAAIAYKPASYRNPNMYSVFCLILERARALKETGQFEKMNLPKSWTDQTVAQMAIWQFTAIQTKNKADDINAKNVAADMMSAMGMTRNTFNAEQRKSLDERVQSILSAVDLTLKGVQSEYEQPDEAGP